MSGNLGPEDRDAAGGSRSTDAASAGIVVEEPLEIESIELGDASSSLLSQFGWETVPATDEPAPLMLEGSLEAPDDSIPAAAAAEAGDDDEPLRLAAQLTELRRQSAAREGALQRELEAVRAELDEREAELSSQEAQIASLALEVSGLRAQLRDAEAPSVVSGDVGGHGGKRNRDDLVASLKARLEERGHALGVAREEIRALTAECDRLRRAGSAARPASAGAADAAQSAGPIAQLLRRLRREGHEHLPAAALAGAPGTEVPTIALDAEPAPPAAAPRQDAARPAALRQAKAHARMRRYLIALDPDVREVFQLDRPRLYAGRGGEASLHLSHETVSRLHAILTLEGGSTVVEDASSTNGVWVNGQRVRRAVLKDGDTVAFGAARYQYRVGPGARH